MEKGLVLHKVRQKRSAHLQFGTAKNCSICPSFIEPAESYTTDQLSEIQQKQLDITSGIKALFHQSKVPLTLHKHAHVLQKEQYQISKAFSCKQLIGVQPSYEPF